MKKALGIFVLGMFIISMSMSFVSAITIAEINTFFDKNVNPVAKFVLGDIRGADAGEMFFIKFLFAIIIFAIVYYSVRQVPNLGEGMTLWLITIAVSLIAIRFLASEVIINFLWLPQGVLGVVLAASLPFILFFFFIESFDSRIIRKVGWSTFIVVYVMLATFKWSSLALTKPVLGVFSNLGWFYLIIAGLSILAIIMDGGIRKTYLNSKSMNLIRAERELIKSKKVEELAKVEEALANNPDNKALEDKKKRIEKAIEKLNKDLAQ